ncbi:hypothetical protein CXG81DRAFT_26933 [Caulochytrium protostelioides]|uniref:Uncharacterized protein n=1 Tax=Caulochytrium protostelioides TaxID=1555241 RepID=A0A4P9X5E6_9FUNG|nr:hypothetical protein CXG81DRAFT_26933 [Caulochytrium protostelioides]|eukprot:RKP00344.1 hypothetical protein CXG81DRAFT_26933 [Caulochytrium protostelioides]
MAESSLPSTLLDEASTVRLLPPAETQQSHALTALSDGFRDACATFDAAAASLLRHADQRAQAVETAKLAVLGRRRLLAAASTASSHAAVLGSDALATEARRLQALLVQKQADVARLSTYAASLQRTAQTQREFLEMMRS